ncbi:MAG: hypothetical protein ACRDNF_04845 [Streptosporangiaceae bacterium]
MRRCSPGPAGYTGIKGVFEYEALTRRVVGRDRQQDIKHAVLTWTPPPMSRS